MTLTSRNERARKACLRMMALACAAGSALLLAPGAARAEAASEAAASAMLEEVSDNAARLRMFLQAMPKGGDLHNHLGGSVYAEDFLEVAAQKGMCADVAITRIVAGPCGDDLKIARMATERPFVFARLVDALSTRGYQRGVGADEVSGHTQFFRSFDRFGAASAGENGRWLALARQSAERNGVSYLELMLDPPGLIDFVRGAGTAPLDEAGIAALYSADSAELAPLLDGYVGEVDRIEAEASARLSCEGKQADPACGVAVHYLTYALRGFSPRMVFRTLLGSFALAHRDPRFVGVNIVMPEDDPVALRDYGLHMAMFRFLEAKYPDVNVTMHAGELALGLVPPQDLADHIARAVASGARRIGHGTDIAYEDDAPETLARMARERIAVEVNLTSNAVILGVKGGEHPIALYRSMGVPVALSTDDEGVLRSDMTNEYRRAVTEQGLGYADLKELARASLEYSFVPGASLWREGRLGEAVSACSASRTAGRCKPFLASSEKARLQADLEDRFERFEHGLDRFNHPQGS
ncbi:adenosine deaminase family protein [Novosphingobium mangrovi (ex Huang et al. 2023)]|uniref:adenosine deaminase n=1 Tax=Novosphingobium mangrovi (ex Huang et al. 2023) TaxID=2976432 RepID=A0ABT2I2C8_9SPHN|nr:adenosine deaminase [Novosphingobium mangrovi (ex Huang et al. 2023)]MCT2398966.1 adenosine deaminase [Novosphingobium mangrovi (ex Huang et al. 2023)]